MFFKFCHDQVAKVCETAANSLAFILERFSDNPHKQDSIVKVVKKNFLKSKTYKKRQLFVVMCGEAMMKKELFERDFKADMLSLVADPVSNVRLALARVLRHHFLNQISGAFVFDIEVNDAVRLLKLDDCKDVKGFVEDIQTFPMNEEKVVEMKEFQERLEKLNKNMEDTVTSQEE